MDVRMSFQVKWFDQYIDKYSCNNNNNNIHNNDKMIVMKANVTMKGLQIITFILTASQFFQVCIWVEESNTANVTSKACENWCQLE